MKKQILAIAILLLSATVYAKPFVQCVNNTCGLISSEGEWIIEPKYKRINYNPDGLSMFIVNDEFGYFDESGKIVIRPQESNIYRFAPNGLAKFKKNNKWGVTDKKFETIVPAKYDFLTDYAPNGLAVAKQDGKYGYIDAKGAVVIPFKYAFAAQFAPNGLAVVEQDGLFGYIDAHDKMVIKPQFKRADSFSQNGLALVLKEEGLGFINAKGDEVIELQKKYKMEPFAPNGLAAIQKDKRYGFMDSKGTVVIPAIYDFALNFNPNGYAIVQKDGKYGVINSAGAFTIKPEFSKINDPLDNYSLALKHESRGWEVYDMARGQILATYKVDEKDVAYQVSNAKGEVIWPKPKNEVKPIKQELVASDIKVNANEKNILKGTPKEEKIVSKESNSINSSVNTEIVTKNNSIKPLKQEPIITTESKPKVIAPIEPTIKDNIQKETTISKKESIQNTSSEIVSKNGIATDSATGLVWQDDVNAKEMIENQDGAKAYCENLTLGGYSDWRLPNIFELTTLLDNTTSKEPYVIDGIQNIKSSGYLSSTTSSEWAGAMWKTNFYFGSNSVDSAKLGGRVRCVRAGQLNFDDLIILKNRGKLKVSQENIDKISPIKNAQEQKRQAQEQERINKLYRLAKNIGDKVCTKMQTCGLFSCDSYEVSAFVEGKSGDRIQIRIADPKVMRSYQGVDIYKGSILWDQYDNWKPCY